MSLIKRNTFPDSDVIEKGIGDWAAAEKKWIKHYRSEGCKLTNLTDGGEGVVGYKPSPEQIERMRRVHLGKKRSPQIVEAMRLRMIGHLVSEETRKKISLANTGKVRTTEQRAKYGASRKGKPTGPMSEAHKQLVAAGRQKFAREHPENFLPRRKAMEDRIYGRLKVLEFDSVENGKAVWICQCSCGQRIYTTGDRLRRGDTRSCGCLGREHASRLSIQRSTESRKRVCAIPNCGKPHCSNGMCSSHYQRACYHAKHPESGCWGKYSK